MTNFLNELSKLTTPAEIAKSALRAELEQRLSECTERQQDMFRRIYTREISLLNEKELKSAIDLVNRTLAKNRAGR